MEINRISAKKIKDSRSDFTIEVNVNNLRASSPSGKSKGIHETAPYHKNMNWNIKVLNKLKIDFQINYFSDLIKLERYIKKKFKLKNVKDFGANALFALESAILKALAKSRNSELWEIINPRAKKFPIPLGNAVGGGLHSHNTLKPEFQEFLIIPEFKNVKENVKIIRDIHSLLKNLLKAKSKNDEGAWQTSFSIEEIIKILSRMKGIKIGMDVAASSFYKKNTYCYKNTCFNRDAQINYMINLINKYKIYYVEDPLEEEDFSGFSKIKESTSSLITGDDLTATQIHRLKKAIKNNSINAMIIKPNQNGSLIELNKIFDICKKNKIKTILSHRSGETLDNALADYAFGFQADFIKTGISTKYRAIKLDRLMNIYDKKSK